MIRVGIHAPRSEAEVGRANVSALRRLDDLEQLERHRFRQAQDDIDRARRRGVPDTIWMALLLALAWLVLILAAAVLSGCGPTAIQVQAKTAGAARTVLDASADAITIRCAQMGDDTRPVCHPDAGGDPDSDACQAAQSAVREKCTAAYDVQRDAVDAWKLWVSALLGALTGVRPLDLIVSLASDALSAVSHLLTTLRDLGAHLPEVPAMLRGLVGGGS